MFHGAGKGAKGGFGKGGGKGGFGKGGGKGGGAKGKGGGGGGKGGGKGGGPSASGQAFFRPSFLENPWSFLFSGEPRVLFDCRSGGPTIPPPPPPPSFSHPVADFLAAVSTADGMDEAEAPPKRSRLSLPPPKNELLPPPSLSQDEEDIGDSAIGPTLQPPSNAPGVT